jgi:hypothetical protein
MPRLFSQAGAMLARFVVALGLFLVPAVGAARADTGCTVNSFNAVSQDQGDAAIGCTGLSEAVAQKLAEILSHILQDRLDPQTILAKLDEVDQIPNEGVARTVNESQRQMIIKTLSGRPTGQIAITANPLANDSAEFAKAIATPLLMLGWQIEGQEIRRAAPKLLDPVVGLAIVVRDRAAAPKHALDLKAALSAAHINAAWVADPAQPPDVTTLWVGRRPGSVGTDANAPAK